MVTNGTTAILKRPDVDLDLTEFEKRALVPQYDFVDKNPSNLLILDFYTIYIKSYPSHN